MCIYMCMFLYTNIVYSVPISISVSLSSLAYNNYNNNNNNNNNNNHHLLQTIEIHTMYTMCPRACVRACVCACVRAIRTYCDC